MLEVAYHIRFQVSKDSGIGSNMEIHPQDPAEPQRSVEVCRYLIELEFHNFKTSRRLLRIEVQPTCAITSYRDKLVLPSVAPPVQHGVVFFSREKQTTPQSRLQAKWEHPDQHQFPHPSKHSNLMSQC